MPRSHGGFKGRISVGDQGRITSTRPRETLISGGVEVWGLRASVPQVGGHGGLRLDGDRLVAADMGAWVVAAA